MICVLSFVNPLTLYSHVDVPLACTVVRTVEGDLPVDREEIEAFLGLVLRLEEGLTLAAVFVPGVKESGLDQLIIRKLQPSIPPKKLCYSY